MPFRLTQRFILLCSGTLLGCVLLLLLAAFPIFSNMTCCSNGMGFPFICLGVILAILCTSSFVFHCMGKKGGIVLFGGASKDRLQHFASLILSEYLRGWFVLSLILSMTLVMVGAAFLFSLSFGFTWAALAGGCLALLLGLAVLLLGLTSLGKIPTSTIHENTGGL